jgi:hypothetical protein
MPVWSAERGRLSTPLPIDERNPVVAAFLVHYETSIACSARNDSCTSGSTSTITAPFLQTVELLVDNAARLSALKVSPSPADVRGYLSIECFVAGMASRCLHVVDERPEVRPSSRVASK